MTITELRQALECDRSSCDCHKGKISHCPAHGDAKPSLSITEGHTAPLLKCFTGCQTKDILLALKERGLWPLSERVTPINRGSEPDHLYRYMNADGEVVGEKGRWDNPKRFAWRMPGDTGWPGGPQMDAMPLYNLADVLRNPGKPVFLVEGEKAVEACIARGLVAVCLAGGAAQTRFGNALDPLAARDVILWPDNDDAGQALMGKVAVYLPEARSVKPVVAPKGDAFDYFAQGGTVESLTALLNEAQSRAWVLSNDAIAVEIPVVGGTVRFDFTALVAAPKAIDTSLKVQVSAIGSRRIPYSQRINLESASAVTDMRRTLAEIFPDKGFHWPAIVSEAKDLAIGMWRGIPRSVSADDTPLIPVREWLVQGLMPLHLTTIPFGMGGSMKSLLMAHLGVHAFYGMDWLGLPTREVKGVLVVDYEDTAEEWRLRLEELCGALHLPVPSGESYRFMPGNGIPLVDQAETIRQVIDQYGIELIIVDSAVSAVGGDLMDTSASQRLVNWFTSLGVTSILIAHNTKAEDSKYPYGNIFWHNLPRSTVYFEATGNPYDKVRDVSITPRKASRGAVQPVGARVTFAGDGEPLTVETLEEAPTTKDDAENDVRWALMDVLAGSPRTIQELIGMTGHTYGVIQNTLRRNKTYFTALAKVGRAQQWGLLDRTHEG